MRIQVNNANRLSEAEIKNAQSVLDRIFEQFQTNHKEALKPSQFFLEFAIELILRDRALCRNKLIEGITDGGGDGGVDCIHIFVDGEWVGPHNQLSIIKRRPKSQIDIYLIQTTLSKKWESIGIQNLYPFANDLLNPIKALPKSNQTYNRPTLKKCRTIREIYESATLPFPTVNIWFYYVSAGGVPHPDFHHWKNELCNHVAELASAYTCQFELLGALELVNLWRLAPPREFCLNLAEEPIRSSDNKSFIVLVGLQEFAQFISDCDGQLDQSLFEANVRDWEGKNKVNQQIRKSLDIAPVEEFWWLNNGITILARDANCNGRRILLLNPEIVNGLQTSRTVHQYIAENQHCIDDARRLLIRIIVLPDDADIDSRREVIRATNSHTAVRDPEIRSLESIHYDIQIILGGHDPPVYYERRKKQYRNVRPRIPRDHIISVSRLAQSVIATLLCRPDDAKARPGDYLRADNEDKYQLVFNSKYPKDLYYVCAMLFQMVDSFMRGDERHSSPSRNVRLSLRYHVLTHVALMYADPKRDRWEKRASRIAKLDVSTIQEYHISDSVSIVLRLYLEFRRQPGRFPWKDFESELLKGVDDYHRRRSTT